jgi:tRNA dimethylallyltransferase
MVGIHLDPSVHDVLIEQRFHDLLDEGFLDEVRGLVARGGLSRTARQALGYRELLAHVEDGVPLAEAVEDAIRRTRTFARRQWSWFRRDPRIRWLDPARDLLGQLVDAWDGAAPRRSSGRPPAGAGVAGVVGD